MHHIVADILIRFLVGFVVHDLSLSFVHFLLTIALSVLLVFTAANFLFGILKLLFLFQ